jgi:hypothetical protein
MFELVNYYDKIKNQKQAYNPKLHIHGLILPFRAIIVAPSGGGKTNVLMNILHITSGSFSRIVICLKSMQEPLYQYLAKQVPEIEFYEDGIIPDLETFDASINNLIVFDDLVNASKETHKIIDEYYIRARKKNVSLAYLSQNYFKTSKNVRINCQYIFIKHLSSTRDLKLIISDYAIDKKIEEIIEIYKKATKDNPLGFILIDLINSSFRINFNK